MAEDQQADPAVVSKAIDYLHKAAAQAVQRSANVEAISHLSMSLELLATLPEAPERDRQELRLQLAGGQGAVRGMLYLTATEDRMPNSTIALTFDFDALVVWFGYPNTTPAMLARGEYGVRVGVPRVLDLLRAHSLPATFFIPGHTIDSFPESVAAILEAGHEVAHHSYAHVDPSTQTLDEERRDLERALEALERIGVKPLGYRSPSADLSEATLSLLEAYDFRYDSSLMADDFRPYRPRIGDRVSQQEPLVQGRAAQLWELPIAFEFDDWVHFQFNFNPYRNGTSAPSKVLEIWTAEFDWMHAHVERGILTVVMHPQVIGRAHRIAMLTQFIAHCRQHRDVRFVRLGDVVEELGQEI